MEDFILYKAFPSGGTVSLMSGLDKTSSDYNDLISIACCFARTGKNVKVLAPVHYKDPQYRRVFGALIGTRYERKCPDLIIDGNYYEYESYVRPWTKRKTSNMITNGLRQSDRIILDNREKASSRWLSRSIRARLKINAPIKEVWAFDGFDVVRLHP